LTSDFLFDAIGTIPAMILNEGPEFYWLKVFRFIHISRLSKPLEYVLHLLLSKYSKKRQNDLAGFTILILMVIYSSHINACVWLWLGSFESCEDSMNSQG